MEKSISDISHFKKIPNIGKELERKLVEAGINSPGELKSIGSINAFMRIRAFDSTACICKLYALEGAIQGVRWHNLSLEKKSELKELYKSL